MTYKTFYCYVMTHKTFSKGNLSQAGQKNEVFTETHLTDLKVKKIVY